MNNKQEQQQLKLSSFCEIYDIPRTTTIELIYREKLPAYKIGSRWYIDIPKFKKWRELHNI